MSSPSTHQDSPKVAEQWPKLTIQRARGYENHSVLKNPSDWPQTPEDERETYIPISALLSDEVVEAVALESAKQRFTGRYSPLTLEAAYPDEKQRACARGEARLLLQATIEQVGGGQGG